MADATLVVGILNLPLAFLELLKPAAWEANLGAAVTSKHYKWAGILLIVLSFFITRELYLVRWRMVVTIFTVMMFVAGLTIGLAPQAFARITHRYYLSLAPVLKRSITYLDAVFRLALSVVFIYSAV